MKRMIASVLALLPASFLSSANAWHDKTHIAVGDLMPKYRLCSKLTANRRGCILNQIGGPASIQQIFLRQRKGGKKWRI